MTLYDKVHIHFTYCTLQRFELVAKIVKSSLHVPLQKLIITWTVALIGLDNVK